MINLQNVKVKYGDFVALDIDKKIEIKDSTRLGVLGENGAGKTTLVNAIIDIVPYEGVINKQIDSKDIAVHMQYNNYNEYMDIKTIMQAILGYKLEESEFTKELIKFFNLENSLKKRYKDLSGGQKQRMTLVLVLSQRAKLTILDEVSSGLDFQTRSNLMNLIDKYYEDKEDNLIVISHYYDELKKLVDDILILNEGKVVDYGNKLDLFNKYCGKTIYCFEKNNVNIDLVKDFKMIKGQDTNIVLSVNSIDEERKLTNILIDNDINFERSTNDIEIMYINALDKFGGKNEK